MARVQVVDPYSGVTLDVDADSPQARAWGGAVAEAEVSTDVEPEPVAGAEPVKRKPGRPKKSE